MLNLLDNDVIDWQRLSDFLWLLQEGWSATDAAVLVGLRGNLEDLIEIWEALDWQRQLEFRIAARHLCNEACKFCEDCGNPVWLDEAYAIGSWYVCGDCRDEHYTCCEGCEELTPDGEITNVDSSSYCESCLGRYCTFCDDCDEYYHDENSDDHQHGGCDCEAPLPKFFFPANGAGTIGENERLTVELPAGVISDEGISMVYYLIANANMPGVLKDYEGIRKVVHSMDPHWQRKEGNFTRRLSNRFYKELGMKLPPSLMSEVGNTARRHTSTVSSMMIEFTRDLNEYAEAFYHDDSCWWGSHWRSRCALKNWGGLGLRSYAEDHHDSNYPNGRVWVQPLNERLKPTHDTLGAHAYVVYNGYGALEGYTPARIVAYLAGMTYRKINLCLGPQYINSGGYLVSDEVTCKNTESVRVTADEHDRFDSYHLETAA